MKANCLKVGTALQCALCCRIESVMSQFCQGNGAVGLEMHVALLGRGLEFLISSL